LVICIVLLTMTIAYLSASSSNHLNPISPASGQPAQAAEFLKFDIPAVTHGLAKTQSLPDGDLFLLPKPMTMAVAGQPEGVRVFSVNIENFGGDGEYIGALPGVTPQGLSLSKSNAKVRALTCAESLWDGNLLIASTGASGDRVRLFLEYPDGAAGPELAIFTV